MTDLLINGNWIEGEGPELISTNPADQAVLYQCHAASECQTHDAIEAAKEAQVDWSMRSEDDRFGLARAFGKHLQQNKDELAVLISQEVGKPHWEALTEVAACIGKVEASIAAMKERRGDTVMPASSGLQALAGTVPWE